MWYICLHVLYIHIWCTHILPLSPLKWRFSIQIVSQWKHHFRGAGPITTGDVLFAECLVLCRVSKHGHSIKRQFAECRTRQRPSLSSAKHSAKRDTRQTSSLPSVRHSAKNNPRQNTSGDAGGGPSVILCRVLAVSTRQTCCLCRVLQAWHSAKRFLCRVPIATLGKVFLFFLIFVFKFFSVAFIQYLEAHVPIWNFSMTFWYIF